MLENAGLINMSKAYCILCLDLTPPTSSKFETTTEVEISTLSHLLVPSLDIKHLNETCLLCEKCSIHFHQTVEIRQEISKLEDQIAKKVDVMRTTILNSEQKKQICWNNEDKEFGSILRMRQYFFPFTTDENDDELEIKTEPENCPDFQDTEAVRNWHVIDGITTTATNNSDLKFDPPSSDEEDASSSFSGLPDPLLVPSTRKRTIPSSTVQKSAKSSRMPNTFSHQNDDDSSSEHEQSENNDCTDRDEDWTEELEEGNEPASHQCTKCGKIVSKKGYLTTHSRRPHPYPCSQCSFTFVTIRERITHQEREHETPTAPPQCVICAKKFRRVIDLEKHMVIKHETDEKNFTCTKCGKGFSLEANFQRHSLLHEFEAERPLVCTVCDTRFAKQDLLDKHKRSHDKLPCELCDATFASRPLLERHIRLHKGEKPFKCDHCEEAFIDTAAKQSHTVRVHLVHHRQKCDLCEKTFISHWALLSHVNNVHKRIRKTKCVTCGDTFIDAAALQSHRIQEHGDDPLTCEECGAKYISIGGLKRHKLKHSGVKSETCHLCDARFLTKQELQKHEFSHSDVRNFVCNHCGRAFKQSGQFRRHLNRVHKEKLPSSSKPRGKLRFTA
ncbi:gastrula zinc finger protein XlCGF26.1 [Folsomia candida]|uniref:gastrula zinc finger protein XlCGF26.1 n=1 Tax=Folsomia candida TaxID=158441 RepID=UPI000B905441|nr:gastrula zinc finger protein XlCGF26.1 [Folsomia candida]